MGIAGDTPRDTVATLVAQVKQLRTELQSVLGDNKQHKAENERLRAREGAIDQRIQSALEGERNRREQERNQVASDRQQTQGLLQDLQRQLDGLSGKGGPSDLPIGLGLEEGDGKRFNRGTSGTQWVEPDDAKVDAKNGSKEPSFPLSFGPAQKSLSAAAESVADVGSRAVGASTKAVYPVVELDAHGVDCHDGADRARADRWNRQRPVPVQGADRPGQPHGQRHRHPRRGRGRGQRHGLGRLDALVRARANPLGHVRVPGRHHPHGAGGRQQGR
ncbi:hypothetical protein [Rhodanobacter lindaniclasticus]